MKKLPVFLVLMAIGELGSPASAQAPAPAGTPTFEVASIKRNNSGTGMISIGMQPGGRLNFTNVPLRQLIIRAYGVQPFQVIGGPDWMSSDRFDVIAKAEGAAAPQEMNLMLRALLADRFKLVVHNETREMAIYYLTRSREDGRLGPELKTASVDCGTAGRGRPGGPPPGAAGPGGAPGGGCQMMITPGRLQVAGQPIANIVTPLANQLGRPVIDKTGLTGGYDFTLSWLPDGGRGIPAGPLPPGAPELPPIDPNAPSLFTALQEQLGLKLEAARGPVEVIVIDSVQQPTED